VTLVVVAAVQAVGPGGLMHLLARPVTSVIALDYSDRGMFDVNPVTNEVHLDAGADVPDAWVLSRTLVTATGADYRGSVDPTHCDPVARGPVSEECRAWLVTQDLSQKITYVPGSSFWPLQWQVSGVLLVLTLGLSWFALWWIRHRLA
jgi:hypothetical protein